MSKRGSGEGGIYQRTSDGRWVGAVHLGYAGGRRQRKVIYGATRNEVADRMKKLLADQQQNLPLATTERLTLAGFLNRWLEDTARPGVRASTYDSYASYIKNHIAPILGRKQLTKLTPQDVEHMMAVIVSGSPGRRKGTGRSPRTAAHARAVLRTALADALKWGMVARNVAALADPPRIEHREITTLPPEQARVFIEGVAGQREEALYVLTLACGLRMGEVTGLAWQDVDLDKGTLRVRQTLSRGSEGWRIGEPKSRTKPAHARASHCRH